MGPHCSTAAPSTWRGGALEPMLGGAPHASTGPCAPSPPCSRSDSDCSSGGGRSGSPPVMASLTPDSAHGSDALAALGGASSLPAPLNTQGVAGPGRRPLLQEPCVGGRRAEARRGGRGRGRRGQQRHAAQGRQKQRQWRQQRVASRMGRSGGAEEPMGRQQRPPAAAYGSASEELRAALREWGVEQLPCGCLWQPNAGAAGEAGCVRLPLERLQQLVAREHSRLHGGSWKGKGEGGKYEGGQGGGGRQGEGEGERRALRPRSADGRVVLEGRAGAGGQAERRPCVCVTCGEVCEWGTGEGEEEEEEEEGEERRREGERGHRQGRSVEAREEEEEAGVVQSGWGVGAKRSARSSKGREEGMVRHRSLPWHLEWAGWEAREREDGGREEEEEDEEEEEAEEEEEDEEDEEEEEVEEEEGEEEEEARGDKDEKISAGAWSMRLRRASAQGGVREEAAEQSSQAPSRRGGGTELHRCLRRRRSASEGERGEAGGQGLWAGERTSEAEAQPAALLHWQASGHGLFVGVQPLQLLCCACREEEEEGRVVGWTGARGRSGRKGGKIVAFATDSGGSGGGGGEEVAGMQVKEEGGLRGPGREDEGGVKGRGREEEDAESGGLCSSPGRGGDQQQGALVLTGRRSRSKSSVAGPASATAREGVAGAGVPCTDKRTQEGRAQDGQGPSNTEARPGSGKRGLQEPVSGAGPRQHTPAGVPPALSAAATGVSWAKEQQPGILLGGAAEGQRVPPSAGLAGSKRGGPEAEAEAEAGGVMQSEAGRRGEGETGGSAGAAGGGGEGEREGEGEGAGGAAVGRRRRRFSGRQEVSVPAGLRGLNNLGNTCFMNAILQALAHTPLLQQALLKRSCREDRGGGCAVCQRGAGPATQGRREDRGEEGRARPRAAQQSARGVVVEQMPVEPQRALGGSLRARAQVPAGAPHAASAAAGGAASSAGASGQAADGKEGALGCPPAAPEPCLHCELKRVVEALFCGEQQPYSPAHFLFRWWQLNRSQADYAQQDAHEFFISALNELHSAALAGGPGGAAAAGVRGGTAAGPTAGEGKLGRRAAARQGQQKCSALEGAEAGDHSLLPAACHCLAHAVFAGVLRSDLTCVGCGATSSTFDPFHDVSLDLVPHRGSGEEHRAAAGEEGGEGRLGRARRRGAANPLEDQAGEREKRGAEWQGGKAKVEGGGVERKNRASEKLQSEMKLESENADVEKEEVEQSDDDGGEEEEVIEVKEEEEEVQEVKAAAISAAAEPRSALVLLTGWMRMCQKAGEPSGWGAAVPPAGPSAETAAQAKGGGEKRGADMKGLQGGDGDAGAKRRRVEARHSATTEAPQAAPPAPAASLTGPQPRGAELQVAEGGQRAELPVKARGAQAREGGGAAPPVRPAVTLASCLQQFTQVERLGDRELFFCQACQASRQAVKQLSFARLPRVLCLHLKRFEHLSAHNTSRKVATPVAFPLHLNMAPFLFPPASAGCSAPCLPVAQCRGSAAAVAAPDLLQDAPASPEPLPAAAAATSSLPRNDPPPASPLATKPLPFASLPRPTLRAPSSLGAAARPALVRRSPRQQQQQQEQQQQQQQQEQQGSRSRGASARAPRHTAGAARAEGSAGSPGGGAPPTRRCSPRLLQGSTRRQQQLRRRQQSRDTSVGALERRQQEGCAPAAPGAGPRGAGRGSASSSSSSPAPDTPAEAAGPPQYELFAAVAHAGRHADSGHYVAFVRVGGRWFRCDDAWVTDAQQEDIHEEEVYMLFYLQK